MLPSLYGLYLKFMSSCANIDSFIIMLMVYYRIVSISGNQADAEMVESTEPDVQQCPYSTNLYPMSSELYATDLEDILQSSNNDLLQSHQLDANKEGTIVTGLDETERSFKTQHESRTLSTNGCRTNAVTGIESVSVDNFSFSSSPMFITTNPCMVNSNDSALTVNELASGSSSVFNNIPHMSCPEVSMQFGEFRTSSPLVSSPSERSSVISASPSSLSVASDSCSVAEICELLGESPSVCQQDFSFPGLSGKLAVIIT